VCTLRLAGHTSISEHGIKTFGNNLLLTEAEIINATAELSFKKVGGRLIVQGRAALEMIIFVK